MSETETVGIVALLGSGETSPAGRRVLEKLLRSLPEPRTIAVLDTPAGFQPNRERVAGKVAEFISERLAQWQPQPRVVATRRATLGTPVAEAAQRVISSAHCIVAGPGSPTYMIDELRDTPYLAAMARAHQAGAVLYISSAATIALSAFSIPVYEIFKVGAEPYWNAGLDFFAPYGMRLALVPHWNNSEGGAEVDTRFCYLGEERFERLRAQLPADVVILGIDEHTACLLDFARGTVMVDGKGGAIVIHGAQRQVFANGDQFPLALLRSDASALPAIPHPSAPVAAPPAAEIDPPLIPLAWEGPPTASPPLPSDLIETLLAIRADLRVAKQWPFADRVRAALTDAGVTIEDTPTGARWHMNET
ncbi:MAG: cysteinyl-tRNA synthetase [Ktedonobacterales bacterium]|nr:cysteinyl-tRNA synthetase [Ktedonobacterales bacterium]